MGTLEEEYVKFVEDMCCLCGDVVLVGQFVKVVFRAIRYRLDSKYAISSAVEGNELVW